MCYNYFGSFDYVLSIGFMMQKNEWAPIVFIARENGFEGNSFLEGICTYIGARTAT